MTEERLGAVVLAYAGSDECRPLVRSLVDQGLPAQSIIVVHNPAHSGQRLKPLDRRIVPLELPRNLGYAAAMNAGIRYHLQGGASLVLLLSQDVRLHLGALPRLLQRAGIGRYGILGPVLRWRGENRPFSFGGVRRADGGIEHINDPNLPRGGHGIGECDWIDGAAMLVQREVFNDVGLLDERFFMYFEEAEFCLRATRAGWKVGVVLDAVAEQAPGGSRRPGAYNYLLVRNGLEYARRAIGARGVASAFARLTRETSDALRIAASPRSTGEARRAAAVRVAANWRGSAAFLVRRWGPPPQSLPGLGDIRGTHGPDGRCAVVSTFPPRRDGIARYAEQLAGDLRRGHQVLTVGLPGSAADRIMRLDGSLRPLRLLPATRRSDEIVLMWHPEFYVTGRVWSRIAAYASLGSVLRLRNARIFVHEPDPVLMTDRGSLARGAAVAERAVQRWFWGSGTELVFHSERERRDFLAAHPGCTAAPTAVVEHGASFQPQATATREEARARLGLDEKGRTFLCIGFLGAHKGFDRAIRAFARLREGAATLCVVGSALYDSPEVSRHVAELRSLAGAVPGVRMEERFLSDEEFDLWILAADAVLTPYRSAASSSVVARARLLGTRVVATPVGGLPEQLGPEDMLVCSDEELAAALLSLAEAARQEVG